MPSNYAYSPYTSYWYRKMVFNSDDFRFGDRNQPGFVFDQQIDDLSLLHVHRCIIPTTYYVFSAPFYVSATINGQAITWPAGNYTATSWIATVTPLLTNTTITYSSITGKLTITNGVGNASISFTANQRAWELLGFNSGTTTAGGSSLEAPNVAQFSGPNFMYLRSSLLASVVNNDNVVFSNSITARNNTPGFVTQNNILAMIPIDENTGSVVNYINDSGRFLWFSPTSLRRVDFYFTLGNRSFPLDFNGVPFQIKLAGFSKDTSNYINNSVDMPPQ